MWYCQKKYADFLIPIKIKKNLKIVTQVFHHPCVIPQYFPLPGFEKINTLINFV